MARTQMRLDAITGSFAGIQAEAAHADRVAKKAPSAIVAADLEDVLGEFSAAIARIHGQDFSNQDAGKFEHATIQLVGNVSGSANLKVVGNITGSGDLLLDKAGPTNVTKSFGDLSVSVLGGSRVQIRAGGTDVLVASASNVETRVLAVMSGAQIQNLVGANGSLIFRDGARIARASSDFIWDDTAKQLKVLGAVSGSGAFTGASAAFDGALSAGGLSSLNGGIAVDGTKFTVTDGSGNVKTEGTLEVDGQATLASVNVEDLTATHVVFAGLSGELSGSGQMTYNAATSILSVNGSTFGSDVTIAGNLTVQGDTVTVNVGELVVEDKDIVVAKNGTDALALDGAGIKVGSGGTYASLTWSETNSKWSASEQLFATVLQSSVAAAPWLKSDADGDIIAGTSAEFGTLLDAVLDAGTGVSIAVDASTKVSTVSIGQPVGTTNNVQFAQITGSMILGTSYVSGAKLYSDVKSAEYMYADASGELKAGDFQFVSDGDIVVDTSTLGKVNFSLSFPVSGTYGSLADAETALGAGLDYIGSSTSVIDALVALDVAIAGLSSTAAASSKKATHTVGAGGFAASANMAGSLSSNFLDELTAANALIFVNGQLMLETADYALDTSAKTLAFSFALVADDVVVVQKA